MIPACMQFLRTTSVGKQQKSNDRLPTSCQIISVIVQKVAFRKPSVTLIRMPEQP